MNELKEENKKLKDELNELKNIITNNKSFGIDFNNRQKMPLEEFNKKFNLNVADNSIK